MDPITALVASPAGRIYSYGTKGGAVHIFDLHQDKVFNTLKPEGFLSIEQMSWSDDGKCFCFSDTNKKVAIVSVTTNESASEPVVEIEAEISVKDVTKGPITQLLFSPNSSSLLVSTSNAVHTISLTSFSVAHSAELMIADCKWIAHPQNPDLIIGFGPGHNQILDWDLIVRQIYISWMMGLPGQMVVDRVIITRDKGHILAQKSLRFGGEGKALHYFTTSEFTVPPGGGQKDTGGLMLPTYIFQGLATEVALPLSFLPQGHLVFLSANSSICSWEVPSNSKSPLIGSFPPQIPGIPGHQQANPAREKFEELLSLQKEPIGEEQLAMCTAWEKEGSFLYPRNGEVIVSNAV